MKGSISVKLGTWHRKKNVCLIYWSVNKQVMEKTLFIEGRGSVWFELSEWSACVRKVRSFYVYLCVQSFLYLVLLFVSRERIKETDVGSLRRQIRELKRIKETRLYRLNTLLCYVLSVKSVDSILPKGSSLLWDLCNVMLLCKVPWGFSDTTLQWRRSPHQHTWFEKERALHFLWNSQVRGIGELAMNDS
jgi:hypothetical protein